MFGMLFGLISRKIRELTPEDLERVTGGAKGPNVVGIIGSAIAVGVNFSMQDNIATLK